MKKIIFAILCVAGVIYISKYLDIINPSDTSEKVEINENVVYKEYNTQKKKSINDISYSDMKSVGISKKKIDKFMLYKDYMGAIEKLEDLNVIPRVSDEDIAKLNKIYIDSKNVSYKEHNINKATEMELKFLGLSNSSIKKIKKKGKIKNMIELKELINSDYNNIKGAITF